MLPSGEQPLAAACLFGLFLGMNKLCQLIGEDFLGLVKLLVLPLLHFGYLLKGQEG